MTLMVLGCGLSPCGLEAPVLYKPYPAPPAMAAEDYDPNTNEIRSLTVPADPIDAQVQLALSAVRGSGAATSELGQEFGDVRKLGDDSPTLLEKATRDALALLVRRRDILIQSIEVAVGPDWAEVTVNYVNLRAPGTRAQRLRSYTRRI